MAKKKGGDDGGGGGSPAWMATFSDLMNLLLCFFVLLFSMSSTDTEKFEEVIASIQSSFSIFSSGGTSIGEGQMISSGISQLEMFDDYFKSVHDGKDQEYDNSGDSSLNGESDGETDTDLTGENISENGGAPSAVSVQDAAEALKEAGANESEEIAEKIEEKLAQYGLQDQVEVDFNANYVMITINGALLFNSGKANLTEDAKDIVDKLAKVIQEYHNNIIEIEGHTDNVPMKSATYENNDVLSMYRALSVAEEIRSVTNLNPAYIKSAGRGEYVPIADNSTAEGRARNRRVEIKIYNSISSELSDLESSGNSEETTGDNTTEETTVNETTVNETTEETTTGTNETTDSTDNTGTESTQQ